MCIRDRFGGISSEIQLPERRQITALTHLVLARLARRARAVLDDAVSNFFLAFTRIQDQRGATAEPGKSLAVIFRIPPQRLALGDDRNHLGPERPIGCQTAREPHVVDFEGRAAGLEDAHH